MLEILINFCVYYNIFVLFYFLALNFLYIFLLFLAAGELFYYRHKREILNYYNNECVLMPSVAVLTPAYNEGATIAGSVSSLIRINYPNLELIVINDGSTDKTLEILKENFKLIKADAAIEEKIKTQQVKCVYKSALYKNLTVIDKENGGKADALNAGINYSDSRLFCAIDADSIIEKNALIKIIHPYLERETRIVALGGIIRVANGCKIENGEVVETRLPGKLLPVFQIVEYIRAFLCGRTGWSKLNNLLIISGAFGLFNRKLVVEAGGYSSDTVGEDMELVVRLHRMIRDTKREYKMVFVPDPVVWTQVPESLRILSRQRNRWQRGLIESLFRHIKMLLNPRYGIVGMIGMPYFFFFEMLGPVIETTGIIVFIISWTFGWINKEFVILFLLLAIVFGILISLFSLLLEEFTLKKYENPADLIKLFFAAVLENFGYRQMNSWWRLKATFDFIWKKKSWGRMERKTFS